MEDNIAVLVDAKMEYTKQLTNIIVPHIFDGVKSIYDTSRSVCEMNKDSNILMRFQEQLSQIPKWNQEIIDEEYNRIIENSKCDWLDELVTAVFLSHTKILTSIRSNKKNNKINLKIPKIDHFIHKCYIESAREIWKNPYLFSNVNNQIEYTRNARDCRDIISNSIEETIRKLLPVKSILKEYLGETETETNDDDSFIPEQYKDNLRKLVKKELQLVNNKEDDLLNLKDLPEILKEDLELASKEVNSEQVLNEKNELENITKVEAPVTLLETITKVEEPVTSLETITKVEAPVTLLETITKVEAPVTLLETITKVEAPVTKIKDPVLKIEDQVTKIEDKVSTLELEKLTEPNLEELTLEKEILPIENKETEINEINLDESNNLQLIVEENLNDITKEENLNDITKEENFNVNPSVEEKKDLDLISNIITNNLYDKNLKNEETSSDIERELNEISLEDMNFKKMDMNDMKIDELNLDDDLFSQDKIEENDLEVIKPTDKKDNIKTIVIEDDRNNVKKYTKDKKNAFRFFD